MSERYYEMEVIIRGTVRVPIDDYEDDKEHAIECIEMTDDVVDIAENIQRNNDKVFFVGVVKDTLKEIER